MIQQNLKTEYQLIPNYPTFVIPLGILPDGYTIADIRCIAHETNVGRILQFPNKNLVLVPYESKIKEGKLNKIYENNFKFGDFVLSRKPTPFKSSMISIMSFDTVRFAIPLPPLDFEAFMSSFLPYQSFTRFKPNQDIESENYKFQLVTPDEMDSLPSDTKTVSFHYSLSGYVIFEMSIPKQLYGHNSLMFWQLDTFFERFRNYLIHITGLNIIHWNEWLLKRIDICYNYHLNSLKDVEDTLSYLSDLRMRNKPCIRNSKGKNIAYWAFQTRTIKFYSKYHEMLEHKKSFDSNTYDEVLESSKTILRFEEEWRTKYLLSKLNLKKVEEVKVSKFIDYVLNHYNRDEHIKSLLGDCSMIDREFSLKETMNTIKTNFKKPNVYIDFLISIIDKGIDKTKLSMSKSTYHDRKKALKSVGIDISVVNERFHNKLENDHDKLKTNFYDAPLSNLFDEEAMFIQSKLQSKPITLSFTDFLTMADHRITDLNGLDAFLPPDHEIKLMQQPNNTK